MRKTLFAFICFTLFISCKKDNSNGDHGATIFFYGNPAATAGWSEIYSINEDGTGEKRLTNFSADGSLRIRSSRPVLSNDGTKIYFSSDKDFPKGELFSVNTDGSGVTKVLSNGILGPDFQDPFLYQNGQKIVYGKALDTFPNWNGEILSVNINGGNKVKLTSYGLDMPSYYPCVNAANTTIIYTCFVSASKAEIYAMNIDGANKRALTSGGPQVKYHPQFSPDGSKIVFEGYVGPVYEIFIMNADGTNITQLTHFGYTASYYSYNNGPTFSKDGRTIYFSSNEADGRTYQLYKINIDGSAVTRLTSTATNKLSPCLK